MNTVDYSVLEQPITSAEIAEFKKNNQTARWILVSYVPAWVMGIVAALFFAAIVPAWVNVSDDNGLLMLILGTFAMSFAIGMYTLAQYGREHVLLARFAKKNNATYNCKVKDPSISGMLFDLGHTRILKDGITFQNGVQVGAFKFVTGSGKSQQTHNWVFASMPLPRKLPHMVLDAKKNNIFKVISNLPESLDKNQRLSLEGDFDQHFTLYAPKEYKTDALYIFTPDVMQAALENGGMYDMEVVDDRFYIYNEMNYGLAKPKIMKSMLDIINKVGREIAEQGDYYADARVGDRAANIVAEPGRRLKTKVGLVSIILVIIYVIYIFLQFTGR
jgi:hypothetical protein